MTIDLTLAADHDAAIAERGVHHEQPAGTDWAAAGIVEKGYPVDWSTSTIPAPGFYAPMQEDSGTTVNDVVGGNDGSIGGTTDVTVGNANGILGNTAYEFAGGTTDNWVTAPYDDNWGAEAWTVFLWFHRDTEAFDATLGGDECLVCVDVDNTASGQYSWQIHIEDGDGSLKFQDSPDNEKIATTTTGLNDGVWHSVALTDDGAHNWTAYLDASNAGSSSTADVNSRSNNNIGIGRSNRSEDRPYGPGEIGHVMFWNSELTSAQITELHEAAL